MGNWYRRLPSIIRESMGLLLVLALLVLLFSVMTRSFLSPVSLSMLANRIPALTLVSVGMTVVLIVGGIDLSVGAVAGLSGVAAGVLVGDLGWTLSTACLAAVVTGGICGLANGAITVAFRIPSFIVTLGMLEICRGLSLLMTGSRTKYLGSAVAGLGEPISGIRVSPAFLIAIGLVLIGQLVLDRTVWGRYAIAVGTNAEAVRMAGLRVWPTQLLAFVVAGVLSGLAGVLDMSRLGSANPSAGVGMELSAIAAVVIGGTSLSGGRGSVVCSFLGVLVISVLQTGLAQLGVADPIKQVITGSVIVTAVILDAWRQHVGTVFSRLPGRWGSKKPKSKNR